MFSIGPLGFSHPALLLLLIVLPLLWWLLHAVPPAPVIRKFPAVGLLVGLKDDESQTDRTPWWLLLLRLFALAALIVAFAGPVLNPQAPHSNPDNDVLIVADLTWADAANWPPYQDRLEELVAAAGRNGQLVAFMSLTDVPKTPLMKAPASVLQARLPSVLPRPWHADDAAAATILEAFLAENEGALNVIWLSDGLAREGRAPLLALLEETGAVRVIETHVPRYAVAPVASENERVVATVLRDRGGAAAQIQVNAIGPDPAGRARVLAQATAVFSQAQTEANVSFDLPPELRNRVSEITLVGHRSAGAVSMADDALKRREVALFSSGSDAEAHALLDPLHFLRQALVPSADLVDGALSETLMSKPDVVILADVATLSDSDSIAMETWVSEGGLLVRFAGPRMAASDVSRGAEDALMPVRLRSGGRSIGGAMSWGAPRKLRAFAPESPFYGLEISDEVVVTSQVIAEPDPNLSERVLARLEDGTPLVTRKRLGKGQVVLFHVTANAQWSSLPLSGLFVQMMERLAISTPASRPSQEDLAGTTWTPLRVLDGFGTLSPPPSSLSGITGEVLADQSALSAAAPPGLYQSEGRQIARNVIDTGQTLRRQIWPARISVEGAEVIFAQSLKGVLLGLALVALMLDCLASLWVSGRFSGPRVTALSALILGVVLSFSLAQEARAQEEIPLDPHARTATAEVVMAYVLTGDARVDEVSRAGLWGLGEVLFQRTSIEPADPIAIDLETDELSFYPMIYWPITTVQKLPTPAAYARLNRFLQKGGMILFDTRDADEQQFGRTTENARHLRMLARQLDVPPLEHIPEDHVLTRSFYLLQDLPGRYVGPPVWVEAAPADATRAEGMPFRNLNDGVTPVVIGGNDWAAAWAMAPNGNRLFTVGRGRAGERQREIAFRFGVNLMMHVLTGNYKSDQVHVPDLLDRLGQ